MPEIGGTTDPGFEPVREAFARNVDEHAEVGAAVAEPGRRHPRLPRLIGIRQRAHGEADTVPPRP
jgi:hypothetical protein